MTERTITIDGQTWTVSISGKATVYDRDEFSLVFERRDEQGNRIRRVSRFSPQGSRSRARALQELTESEMNTLLAQSQPAWTSPELGYAR